MLPHLDSIAEFTALFAAVTIFSGWFATSSPRLSYFGLQVAFAFYRVELRGFAPETQLTPVRDNVAGIILGLVVMWAVFDQLARGRDSMAEMKHSLLASIQHTIAFIRERPLTSKAAYLKRICALRESINEDFSKVRTSADAVLSEFGPNRAQALKLRANARAWQPQIRTLFLVVAAIAQTEPPPGVIIDHEPETSGRYIGSPSIAILPNGTYVASHDFFGPNSGETTSGITRIFVSTDKGRTWQRTAELHDQFWSTLFVHHRQLYLMGTSFEYGRIVIRRASDNAATWTPPSFITSDAGYHTAPVPLVEKNRRLWRAFEYHPAGPWGHFEALMLSAPTTADLLNPKSWSLTERVPYPPQLSEGDTFLEGNAVIAPDGFVYDILRVHNLEKSATFRVLNDERMHFEGLNAFPGGAKKFTIRFDPQTKLYWTLANPAPTENPLSATNPAAVRNVLNLLSSPDLITWRTEHLVLTYPDHLHYAFQYVDWQFAGPDIIFVSRTAWDAARAHDANYLTFHRLPDFRIHKTEDQ